MTDPSTSNPVRVIGANAPGRPPRSQWTVLASTSLAMFAVFLDTTILFVAFPSITVSFSTVSPTTLSWVLNAYTIVFAALLIPAGRLADRVGRRRTFLTAVVIFTAASMLCGLAPAAGPRAGGCSAPAGGRAARHALVSRSWPAIPPRLVTSATR